jgi:hypothetical protein
MIKHRLEYTYIYNFKKYSQGIIKQLKKLGRWLTVENVVILYDPFIHCIQIIRWSQNQFANFSITQIYVYIEKNYKNIIIKLIVGRLYIFILSYKITSFA